MQACFKVCWEGCPKGQGASTLDRLVFPCGLAQVARARKSPKFPLTPFSPIFAHSDQIHRAQWQKTETTEKRRKNRKRSGENGERSGESGERSGERSGESGERSGESGERSGESGERGKTARKAEKKTWEKRGNLNFGIFVLKSQPKMSKTQFFREIVANSPKNAFGAESGLFRANLLRCALKLRTDKFLPIFWRNCGVSS